MLYRKLFWKTLFALEIRATKLVLLTSSPPEALLPTPPFCQLSLRRRWASATNHGYPGYPPWPCPEAGGSGILVLSDELNHRSIVEGGTFFQQKQVEHASTKISTFAYFKTIHGYTDIHVTSCYTFMICQIYVAKPFAEAFFTSVIYQISPHRRQTFGSHGACLCVWVAQWTLPTQQRLHIWYTIFNLFLKCN